MTTVFLCGIFIYVVVELVSVMPTLSYAKYANHKYSEGVSMPYIQWSNKDQHPGILVTSDQAETAGFSQNASVGGFKLISTELGGNLIDSYHHTNPAMAIINVRSKYFVQKDDPSKIIGAGTVFDPRQHAYRVQYLVALFGLVDDRYYLLHERPFTFTPKGVVGARFGTVLLPMMRKAVNRIAGANMPSFLFVLPLTGTQKETVVSKENNKRNSINIFTYKLPSSPEELDRLFIGEGNVGIMEEWYEEYRPIKQSSEQDEEFEEMLA